jgi:hypothetical protein
VNKNSITDHHCLLNTKRRALAETLHLVPAMSRAVSPMQALREAFLEVDMEELMLSDEEDGSSEVGGGVAERDLPSGAHWASAWAAAADEGDGAAVALDDDERVPAAAPPLPAREPASTRSRLRTSAVGRPTLSSASQARKAPLAQPSREDVLLEAAMQKLERRGGNTVVWPKVDPIALMDARHAATRAAREARMQRRAAAAEATAAAPSPAARAHAAHRRKPAPAPTRTPRGKTPIARRATKFSPLDSSPSPPPVAGDGSRKGVVQLAEVRRKLSLDEEEGSDGLSTDDTVELLADAAVKKEAEAAEAARAKVQSDEASAAASARAKAEADMLEAAVKAAEADLIRVTAETAAKEAAHAAEAARLTRLKAELDQVERAVCEQKEARLAAAAAQEALLARRQQLSSRIARRHSRDALLLWQRATECARAKLAKAERHHSWRHTERAWRVWVRWLRTQLAEAAARAHEDSLRREHAAMALAADHYRRVAMRAVWDRVVCAVNICRQEALIAAEQSRRQEAASRLLAQRAQTVARGPNPGSSDGGGGGGEVAACRSARSGAAIVPVNATGVSPVGQYKHMPALAAAERGPGDTQGGGVQPMAALAAMIATEAIAARVVDVDVATGGGERSSPAGGSSQRRRQPAAAEVAAVRASPGAVALVPSSLTQSDEALVRTTHTLKHITHDPLLRATALIYSLMTLSVRPRTRLCLHLGAGGASGRRCALSRCRVNHYRQRQRRRRRRCWCRGRALAREYGTTCSGERSF